MARNRLTRSAKSAFGSGYRQNYKRKQCEVAEGMKPPSTLSRFISMKSLLRHLTLSPLVNSVF